MKHPSVAAKPHSLPAGESREHQDLGREVSETRGEFRTLKWASALAFLAIVGTMGFFYQALGTFNETQKDIRQSLGAIYQQTIELDERLDRQGERQEQMDGRLHSVETELALVEHRLGQVESGLEQVNGRLAQMDGRLDQMGGRLDQMDGRLEQMDGRLDQMDGRLDQMDGRFDQMNGRLGNMEDLLRVLVERSADPA